MNGKAVSPAEVFGHQRIKIPVAYQEVGKVNIYEICYQNEYAKNGEGLHIFEDPEDHKHYLYSQFETFLAHKMFPCFDQPNLKAVLRLITISPSEWTIISAEYEEENVEVDSAGEAFKLLDKLGLKKEIIQNFPRESKVNLRIFKETPKISTYLYSVIAGPYEMFKKEKEGNFPPMRIFVRKSLKKFVEKDAEEFFYITKKGIEYYESIFGYKFPYNKYDQIYVPEFNWGGMENVGAITYTELLVFKDAATHQQYMRFANVILHELAHQWFGDLVTMNWWNDLWLNESFATFISYLCMVKQPGLEKYNMAWKTFNLSKDRAYRDDQLPTTHPIAGKVESTEDAENAFDGITYQKGSSVLKQLYYLMGEESFVDGLKEYFPKYEWSNTKLEDLIQCFQNGLKKHGSDIDLKHWVDIWLKTSGINELTPEFKVKDGKVTEFNILQKSAEYGDRIPRVHRLIVGVYDSKFNEKLYENILVQDKEKTPIPQLVGIDDPTAVFLNINDYAYAKIRLDGKSFDALTQNLRMVSDPLTRLMILRSVWDMVRDCIEPASKYLEILRLSVLPSQQPTQLPHEHDADILNSTFMFAGVAISKYLPIEYREKEAGLMFETIRKMMDNEKDENVKKILLSYLISFAVSHAHKMILLEWLQKGISAPGYVLQRVMRKAINKQLEGPTCNSEDALQGPRNQAGGETGTFGQGD
eukprot:TRINITY_DN97_c0_g1_i2.p1 TRINITY_DN97_c0_g1~~TRINITY_DN97_c0_g1_i2.p1  ORF type:complete len:699 (-),score=94.22 TRINITY_DN97_c0_g1_i2:7098-9194(-)